MSVAFIRRSIRRVWPPGISWSSLGDPVRANQMPDKARVSASQPWRNRGISSELPPACCGEVHRGSAEEAYQCASKYSIRMSECGLAPSQLHRIWKSTGCCLCTETSEYLEMDGEPAISKRVRWRRGEVVFKNSRHVPRAGRKGRERDFRKRR